MQDKNEIFRNTRIRFDQMYEDSVQFLQQTYGSVGRYFSNASPFGQLLRVTLNMGRLIFLYIEDSITELNINKATRADSVRGLAALVGHNSTRSISASGDIRLTYNGNIIDIYGNTLIIPNFTVVKNNTNGLKYTIVLQSEEVRMELTERNSIIVKVIQGEIETQKFLSDGGPLQSYNAAVRGGKNIDHFFVNVYVNGENWQVYDSIYDMPREAKGCLVKTSVNTGIDIFFGNGNFGLIPTNGAEIRIEYMTNQGSAGNINATDKLIEWKFLDDGFDTTGETIDINEVIGTTIETPIDFGTDFEPLFLTRLLAPKTSRSFVLATPENYIIFLEKFNYFGIIDAFTTFDDDYIDDDNVIYLFLVPDINKKITGTDNYFTITQNDFILTTPEKNKVYQLIEESGQKMVTAVNEIIDPIIKKYILNISLIVFEGNSRDFIKQQIISILSEYFATNRRRDRIPKSDLIRLIEEVQGVDSVNLWFISEENEASLQANPDAELIGLDEFGDIIIGRGELPLIRGGWEDRNRVFYEDSTNDAKPSTVNILIKKTIPLTYNMERHRINVENIRNIQ